MDLKTFDHFKWVFGGKRKKEKLREEEKKKKKKYKKLQRSYGYMKNEE